MPNEIGMQLRTANERPAATATIRCSSSLSDASHAPASILEAFDHNVARAADKDAIVFLGDGASETDKISYAQLQARALGVTDFLRRRKLDGMPVLLLFPPGIEFLIALMGCLRARAIAIPAPYPSPSRAWDRIQVIARDARPRAILTTAAFALARDSRPDDDVLADVPWFAIDDIAAMDDHALRDELPPKRDDIAFVQYSSGSTSDPKGVIVSHGNLAHNEEMLRTVFGHGPHSIGVNWVPAYHDMGLVGGLLQTLYCGATSIMLPPLKVLQHPILWLQAISRYRANTSAAPTFAYEFCTRRISSEQRAELDLASWDVAICGAEPVRARVLEEFAAAFAPAGFSASAFSPAYGLAEATLLATVPRKGAGAHTCEIDADRLTHHEVQPAAPNGRAMRLVSCGRPHLDQEVKIVDPETGATLPENRVGEIWLAGGSVGQGYWNRLDETIATFGARLPDDHRSYLRTGDLGFIGTEGLFVTGRLKEVLIVRGNNFYPQDIEEAVRSGYAGFAGGESCAFAVDSASGEAVVVVLEPARHAARHLDGRAATEAAVTALSRNFGLQLYDFVLVRPGALPRTTSGKLQRRLCRDFYLSSALSLLGVATEHPALGRTRAR